MKSKRIAIVGGTGFLGLFFIQNLLKDGFEILLILRETSIKKVNSLIQNYPHTFKIQYCNFQDLTSNNLDLSKVDAFIYLIGILSEKKSVSFEEAHLLWPKYFISLCQKFHIKHFIFFSAISNISSIPFISKKYILTKEQAEDYLKNLKIIHYTIFKSSLIYKNYSFFFTFLNKIITFLSFIPILKNFRSFKPVSIYQLYPILKDRILHPYPKNLFIETKDFNSFHFN